MNRNPIIDSLLTEIDFFDAHSNNAAQKLKQIWFVVRWRKTSKTKKRYAEA